MSAAGSGIASASEAAAERVEPAPVELGRTGAQFGAGRPRQAALERVLFARPDRLRRFGIERCRGARPAALVAQRRHLQGSFHTGDGDRDRVTNAEIFGGVRAHAVDVHAAAAYRLRGGAAGLEEACRPQPFVHSYGIHLSQPRLVTSSGTQHAGLLVILMPKPARESPVSRSDLTGTRKSPTTTWHEPGYESTVSGAQSQSFTTASTLSWRG